MNKYETSWHDKVEQMSDDKDRKSEFWLFKTYGTWTCTVKLSNGTSMVEIKVHNKLTREEAVDEAFVEFSRITSALPEFAPLVIEHFQPPTGIGQNDDIPY